MHKNHKDVIHFTENPVREPKKTSRLMRAIDLYSGIGGWTLGLQMAGVETVASYEWWDQANETYGINFGRTPHEADVRTLPLDAFPHDVDLVVGSPPCTQFSFANRGGNGDISDGLRDIHKFLEVVAQVRPKFWAMENVPRVAGILERELNFGGSLRRFSDLVTVITVVDMADYGLPQRRRRMIAGHFPVDLLLAYQGSDGPPTLGQVLSGLGADPVVDPIYGFTIDRDALRDHLPERSLTPEEARLNREAKQQHPFYNVMSFPDPLDRTARTVTALCTRVSRESIVVRNGSGRLRRLTIRERATLQGFPITFQIAGRSYTDKLKMVGNALPPLMAYVIAHSMLGTAVSDLRPLAEHGLVHQLPRTLPPEIRPRAPRNRYPDTRRFRAVIPGLRFGSGVRFELVNQSGREPLSWEINFYFGTSRSIRSIPLGERLATEAKAILPASTQRRFGAALQRAAQGLSRTTAEAIQGAWTHREQALHPFELVDRLGAIADNLVELLPESALDDIRDFVLDVERGSAGPMLNRAHSEKLRRNAPRILVGFIVGGWFNAHSGLRDARSRALSEAV